LDRPLDGGGGDRGELVVGGGQGRRGLLVIGNHSLGWRRGLGRWGRRGRRGRLTLLLLGPLRWLNVCEEQWEKGGHGDIAVAITDSKSFAATHNHGNPPSRDWGE
jgi:hypothetical protein